MYTQQKCSAHLGVFVHINETWYKYGLCCISLCRGIILHEFNEIQMDNDEQTCKNLGGLGVTAQKLAKIQHLRLYVKFTYSDDLPVISLGKMHCLH